MRYRKEFIKNNSNRINRWTTSWTYNTVQSPTGIIYKMRFMDGNGNEI